MSSKRFINHKDTIVTEALDGLLALDGRLARLDGYPYIKVVTRAQLDPQRVALISGGGSGHEPAHAGFVGEGMLSAAVCGELFASPSVEAVDAALMSACGDAGCLLVVKNYTGDRLNFGLAAERARNRGKRVETVLVADDIALPDSVQARGVAGTLFVHKIAGHHAEQGAPLERVSAIAREVAADLRSLGVSLESCTIPGQPSTSTLAANEGELGLGIHGEPGVEKIELQSVREIVALMSARLEATLADEDRPCAALLNNLGAVPSIEMSVIAHELLRSSLGPRIELVVGPAPLMTSLDMNGFSLSLLPLDEARRVALSSPCGPAAWPGVREPVSVQPRPLPSLGSQTRAQPSSEPHVRAHLEHVLDALEAARDRLDALDAKIGDGDTGSSLAAASRSIREQLSELPLADAPALLDSLGELLAKSMGGSLGVLASLFFTAASRGLDAGSWAEAIGEGLARVSEYGGAEPGDRTFIDALEPARAALEQGRDLTEVAAAARAGAEATQHMHRARAGRSAYVGAAALEGVQDPGAAAIALIFAALAGAE